MGKILLVNQDENMLEFTRITLEEMTAEEVLVATTSSQAIALLMKHSFRLVISDNQNGVLLHLIAHSSEIPFLFFTDDKALIIPFTPKMFIGIWRINQFKDMCSSIVHLLKL